MKRQKMGNAHNKRNFKNSTGVHPKNNSPAPMRGGIRL